MTSVRRAADYRERGIRRWDLDERLSLYCSASEYWWGGPIVQKGWTLHILFGRFEFATLYLTRENAYELLRAATMRDRFQK
jgi:hypothetical protein